MTMLGLSEFPGKIVSPSYDCATPPSLFASAFTPLPSSTVPPFNVCALPFYSSSHASWLNAAITRTHSRTSPIAPLALIAALRSSGRASFWLQQPRLTHTDTAKPVVSFALASPLLPFFSLLSIPSFSCSVSSSAFPEYSSFHVSSLASGFSTFSSAWDLVASVSSLPQQRRTAPSALTATATAILRRSIVVAADAQITQQLIVNGRPTVNPSAPEWNVVLGNPRRRSGPVRFSSNTRDEARGLQWVALPGPSSGESNVTHRCAVRATIGKRRRSRDSGTFAVKFYAAQNLSITQLLLADADASIGPWDAVVPSGNWPSQDLDETINVPTGLKFALVQFELIRHVSSGSSGATLGFASELFLGCDTLVNGAPMVNLVNNAVPNGLSGWTQVPLNGLREVRDTFAQRSSGPAPDTAYQWIALPPAAPNFARRCILSATVGGRNNDARDVAVVSASFHTAVNATKLTVDALDESVSVGPYAPPRAGTEQWRLRPYDATITPSPSATHAFFHVSIIRNGAARLFGLRCFNETATTKTATSSLVPKAIKTATPTSTNTSAPSASPSFSLPATPSPTQTSTRPLTLSTSKRASVSASVVSSSTLSVVSSGSVTVRPTVSPSHVSSLSTSMKQTATSSGVATRTLSAAISASASAVATATQTATAKITQSPTLRSSSSASWVVSLSRSNILTPSHSTSSSVAPSRTHSSPHTASRTPSTSMVPTRTASSAATASHVPTVTGAQIVKTPTVTRPSTATSSLHRSFSSSIAATPSPSTVVTSSRSLLTTVSVSTPLSKSRTNVGTETASGTLLPSSSVSKTQQPSISTTSSLSRPATPSGRGTPAATSTQTVTRTPPPKPTPTLSATQSSRSVSLSKSLCLKRWLPRPPTCPGNVSFTAGDRDDEGVGSGSASTSDLQSRFECLVERFNHSRSVLCPSSSAALSSVNDDPLLGQCCESSAGAAANITSMCALRSLTTTEVTGCRDAFPSTGQCDPPSAVVTIAAHVRSFVVKAPMNGTSDESSSDSAVSAIRPSMIDSVAVVGVAWVSLSSVRWVISQNPSRFAVPVVPSSAPIVAFCRSFSISGGVANNSQIFASGHGVEITCRGIAGVVPPGASAVPVLIVNQTAAHNAMEHLSSSSSSSSSSSEGDDGTKTPSFALIPLFSSSVFEMARGTAEDPPPTPKTATLGQTILGRGCALTGNVAWAAVRQSIANVTATSSTVEIAEALGLQCGGHGQCHDPSGTCSCTQSITDGFWATPSSGQGLECSTCSTGWCGGSCSTACGSPSNIPSGSGSSTPAAVTPAPASGVVGADLCANVSCGLNGHCDASRASAGPSLSPQTTQASLCACNAYWFNAPACDVSCPGLNANGDGLPCNGHGTCRTDAVSGAPYCVCVATASGAWVGPGCEHQCPIATSGAVCGNRGRCVYALPTNTIAGLSASGPQAKCECTSPLYGGSTCESCAPGLGGPSCTLTCPGITIFQNTTTSAVSVNGRPCSGRGVCDLNAGTCACYDASIASRSTSSFVASLLRLAPDPSLSLSQLLDGHFHGPQCGECRAGWYGPACARRCPVGGADCQTICGGHGSCADGRGGSGVCTCHSSLTEGFWSGSTCGSCAAGIYGTGCTQKCPVDSNGVCGGHGSCSDGLGGSGQCSCADGFALSSSATSGSTASSMKVCATCAARRYGSACAACPSTCGSHGRCNDGLQGDGKCTCDAGFVGSECDLPCPTATDGSVCGSHGTCAFTTTGSPSASSSFAVCACASNYAGPTCSECAANFFGSACRSCPDCGAGRCHDGRVGNGSCACPDGFGGARCAVQCPASVPTGDAVAVPCTGHGRCDSTTAQCVCDSSPTIGFWAGSACEQCAPSHEGSRSAQCTLRCPVGLGSAVCSGRGQCVSGTCVCTSNTSCGVACEVSGASCAARVSTLSLCPNQCSGHGRCLRLGSVVNATYGCSCDGSWAHDDCSLLCPNDRCGGPTRGTCNVLTTPALRAVCECRLGFWGTGCEKACPRSASGAVCAGHGICSATNGQCSCKIGFGGAVCDVACPVGVPTSATPSRQTLSAVTMLPCSGNGVCSSTTGACTCSAEFTGAACSECVSGLSGGACDVPCPPSRGQTIGTVCSCSVGYSGPGCRDSCPTGVSPRALRSRLAVRPEVCSGAGRCDVRNSTCTCDDSFFGNACNVQCTLSICVAAAVAANPSVAEVEVQKGRWACDPASGKCTCSSDRRTGYWAGPLCTECQAKYWGSSCALRCPCDHATCDRTTGECHCFADTTKGFWAGARCDMCDGGYVGPDCRTPNTPLSSPALGIFASMPSSSQSSRDASASSAQAVMSPTAAVTRFGVIRGAATTESLTNPAPVVSATGSGSDIVLIGSRNVVVALRTANVHSRSESSFATSAETPTSSSAVCWRHKFEEDVMVTSIVVPASTGVSPMAAAPIAGVTSAFVLFTTRRGTGSAGGDSLSLVTVSELQQNCTTTTAATSTTVLRRTASAASVDSRKESFRQKPLTRSMASESVVSAPSVAIPTDGTLFSIGGVVFSALHHAANRTAEVRTVAAALMVSLRVVIPNVTAVHWAGAVNATTAVICGSMLSSSSSADSTSTGSSAWSVHFVDIDGLSLTHRSAKALLATPPESVATCHAALRCHAVVGPLTNLSDVSTSDGGSPSSSSTSTGIMCLLQCTETQTGAAVLYAVTEHAFFSLSSAGTIFNGHVVVTAIGTRSPTVSSVTRKTNGAVVFAARSQEVLVAVTVAATSQSAAHTSLLLTLRLTSRVSSSRSIRGINALLGQATLRGKLIGITSLRRSGTALPTVTFLSDASTSTRGAASGGTSVSASGIVAVASWAPHALALPLAAFTPMRLAPAVIDSALLATQPDDVVVNTTANTTSATPVDGQSSTGLTVATVAVYGAGLETLDAASTVCTFNVAGHSAVVQSAGVIQPLSEAFPSTSDSIPNPMLSNFKSGTGSGAEVNISTMTSQFEVSTSTARVVCRVPKALLAVADTCSVITVSVGDASSIALPANSAPLRLHLAPTSTIRSIVNAAEPSLVAGRNSATTVAVRAMTSTQLLVRGLGFVPASNGAARCRISWPGTQVITWARVVNRTHILCSLPSSLPPTLPGSTVVMFAHDGVNFADLAAAKRMSQPLRSTAAVGPKTMNGPSPQILWRSMSTAATSANANISADATTTDGQKRERRSMVSAATMSMTPAFRVVSLYAPVSIVGSMAGISVFADPTLRAASTATITGLTVAAVDSQGNVMRTAAPTRVQGSLVRCFVSDSAGQTSTRGRVVGSLVDGLSHPKEVRIARPALGRAEVRCTVSHYAAAVAVTVIPGPPAGLAILNIMQTSSAASSTASSANSADTQKVATPPSWVATSPLQPRAPLIPEPAVVFVDGAGHRVSIADVPAGAVVRASWQEHVLKPGLRDDTGLLSAAYERSPNSILGVPAAGGVFSFPGLSVRGVHGQSYRVTFTASIPATASVSSNSAVARRAVSLLSSLKIKGANRSERWGETAPTSDAVATHTTGSRRLHGDFNGDLHRHLLEAAAVQQPSQLSSSAQGAIATAQFAVELPRCGSSSEYAIAGTPQCHPCPSNAVCDGSTDITSEAGFWRAPASTVVYSCPSNACDGELHCSDGYTGALCGTCADGFGRSGGTGCATCTSPYLAWSFISVALVALSVIVYILSYRSILDGWKGVNEQTVDGFSQSQRIDGNEKAMKTLGASGLSEHRASTASTQASGDDSPSNAGTKSQEPKRNPLTLALKLLLGHLQLAAVIGTVPSEIPSAVADFFGAEKRGGSPMTLDFALITCVVAKDQHSKTIAILMAVLAVTVGAVMIRVLHAAVVGVKNSSALSVQNRALFDSPMPEITHHSSAVGRGSNPYPNSSSAVSATVLLPPSPQHAGHTGVEDHTVDAIHAAALAKNRRSFASAVAVPSKPTDAGMSPRAAGAQSPCTAGGRFAPSTHVVVTEDAHEPMRGNSADQHADERGDEPSMGKRASEEALSVVNARLTSKLPSTLSALSKSGSPKTGRTNAVSRASTMSGLVNTRRLFDDLVGPPSTTTFPSGEDLMKTTPRELGRSSTVVPIPSAAIEAGEPTAGEETQGDNLSGGLEVQSRELQDTDNATTHTGRAGAELVELHGQEKSEEGRRGTLHPSQSGQTRQAPPRLEMPLSAQTSAASSTDHVDAVTVSLPSTAGGASGGGHRKSVVSDAADDVDRKGGLMPFNALHGSDADAGRSATRRPTAVVVSGYDHHPDEGHADRRGMSGFRSGMGRSGSSLFYESNGPDTLFERTMRATTADGRGRRLSSSGGVMLPSTLFTRLGFAPLRGSPLDAGLSPAALVEFAVVALVVALFLAYPSAVEAAAGGIRCRTIDRGGARGSLSLLAADLSIDCENTSANSQRVVSGIILLALGVGAPCLAAAFVGLIARVFRGGDMAAARRVMYYTTGGYKPKRWWWESVLLARKAAIVALATVVTPERLNLATLQWALLIATWLAFSLRPFAVRVLSRLELASVTTLLVTAMLSALLEFSRNTTGDVSVWLWGIAQLIVNAGVILYFLIAIARLGVQALPPPLRSAATRMADAVGAVLAERQISALVHRLHTSDSGGGGAAATHSNRSNSNHFDNSVDQSAAASNSPPLFEAADLDIAHGQLSSGEFSGGGAFLPQGSTTGPTGFGASLSIRSVKDTKDRRGSSLIETAVAAEISSRRASTRVVTIIDGDTFVPRRTSPIQRQSSPFPNRGSSGAGAQGTGRIGIQEVGADGAVAEGALESGVVAARIALQATVALVEDPKLRHRLRSAVTTAEGPLMYWAVAGHDEIGATSTNTTLPTAPQQVLNDDDGDEVAAKEAGAGFITRTRSSVRRGVSSSRVAAGAELEALYATEASVLRIILDAESRKEEIVNAMSFTSAAAAVLPPALQHHHSSLPPAALQHHSSLASVAASASPLPASPLRSNLVLQGPYVPLVARNVDNAASLMPTPMSAPALPSHIHTSGTGSLPTPTPESPFPRHTVASLLRQTTLSQIPRVESSSVLARSVFSPTETSLDLPGSPVMHGRGGRSFASLSRRRETSGVLSPFSPNVGSSGHTSGDGSLSAGPTGGSPLWASPLSATAPRSPAFGSALHRGSGGRGSSAISPHSWRGGQGPRAPRADGSPTLFSAARSSGSSMSRRGADSPVGINLPSPMWRREQSLVASAAGGRRSGDGVGTPVWSKRIASTTGSGGVLSPLSPSANSAGWFSPQEQVLSPSRSNAPLQHVMGSPSYKPLEMPSPSLPASTPRTPGAARALPPLASMILQNATERHAERRKKSARNQRRSGAQRDRQSGAASMKRSFSSSGSDSVSQTGELANAAPGSPRKPVPQDRLEQTVPAVSPSGRPPRVKSLPPSRVAPGSPSGRGGTGGSWPERASSLRGGSSPGGGSPRQPRHRPSDDPRRDQQSPRRHRSAKSAWAYDDDDDDDEDVGDESPRTWRAMQMPRVSIHDVASVGASSDSEEAD